MEVREAKSSDTAEWIRLRIKLWPDASEEHTPDIEDHFSFGNPNILKAYVLDKGDETLGGFIELSIRNYVEGSELGEAPFVEGWFVEEHLRGQGYGKKLMQAAEAWSLQQGFQELGSDAELENTASLRAHKAIGFEEVERIVCFIKKLG